MQEQGPAASGRKITEAQSRKRRHDRERIMDAALSLAGEIGYDRLTVRKVLAHGGGHVGQFYAEFDNIGDCFANAYTLEAERLCTAMLGAAEAAGDWREGTRAALVELFRFAAEKPLVARALLCEVYVAGDAALAKHDEVLERLALKLDRGFRQRTGVARASAPIAPVFLVGAVEGLVRVRLAADKIDRLTADLPELMYLLVGPFLGDVAAREELTRPT
jgi:AcrR family transcriptional regulator